nr:hypothetical protein BaRGS_010340 [Batillaria attramentaria]
MQEKGEVLRQEAESMFQTEEAESATKEEKLRHAVGLAQQVYSQGEEVLGGRGEAAILKQFGKLKERRDTVSPDIYQEKVLAPPPVRSGPRSSLSRSIASTGSLGSFSMSNQSMGFLDGPQSLFEFWAGLESDKYPFGLGDICVLQPRATILITYLTSDLLRLEKDAITLVHAVSMKKQYRAVTSLDYRTLALATDNKKSHNNAITIVRFDSSDFRSYTHLKTISGRVPYSMCVSSHSHIIVSDSENKALLALGPDGEQRFVFQPPKHSRVIDTPGGVACSPSGFLYLVDSCEQRILRFNSRGKFLKVVLSQEDGLEWPIAVACVDDSTLCVAEFYGQVKVFQCSKQDNMMYQSVPSEIPEQFKVFLYQSA